MTASKLRAMKSLGSVTISAVSRQLAGWAFTSVYLPGVIAACTVMSPERRATAGPSMVRAWGRTMSRIGRVEVRFTPRARAALSRREPRVLSFNHSSTLDVLTGAMVLPPGGVLVVKQEMRKVPLMGLACEKLGSVFLERGNRESAYQSLQAAAARVHREQLQLLISPEGTRSATGELGRFKLGAFHLAAVAGVPILPVVLHNHFALWPQGQLAPTPGTVWIDTLAPIFITEDDDARAIADDLRTRYERALADGPVTTA